MKINLVFLVLTLLSCGLLIISAGLPLLYWETVTKIFERGRVNPRFEKELKKIDFSVFKHKLISSARFNFTITFVFGILSFFAVQSMEWIGVLVFILLVGVHTFSIRTVLDAKNLLGLMERISEIENKLIQSGQTN